MSPMPLAPQASNPMVVPSSSQPQASAQSQTKRQPRRRQSGAGEPANVASAAAATSMMQLPQQTSLAQTPPVTSEQTIPPTTVQAGGVNVISCSDTDGEAKEGCSTRQSGSKKTATPSKRNSSTAGPNPIAPAARRGSQPTATTGTETDENDMVHLTPADKAKANRDRNREHARNTRLRKKAYLEKLKITVDELCRERDTLVSERAGAANLLVEMHNTRTEVLMSFFALRSAYEKRRELWASILDESCFACVMPVTPYRSFPASEVQVSKCQRTVLGIDGMMADTASLHVLLNSLVDRSRYPLAAVQFRYTLVTEDAVVAGNQMMARWVMTTLNATQCGARMEVTKQGMLCCKFNSAHKIIGLELMFDVMAFMLQLKQATGSDTFAVVPNTVQTCQRPFNTPMVMTLAERPYTIVQVNKLWEEMTGHKAEDVVGKVSCRILQGQETDRESVGVLMSDVRYKRPASARIVNYTKSGRRFRNYLNAYPLSTDSKITHYVGLVVHIEWIDGDKGTAQNGMLANGVSSGGTSKQVAKPPQQSGHGPPRPQVPKPVGVVSSSPPSGMASSGNVPSAVPRNSDQQPAVQPRQGQPPQQPTQQVVVSGPGRQDSCNTGGADTVSSLTSSVSSGSSQGSNSGNSSTSARGAVSLLLPQPAPTALGQMVSPPGSTKTPTPASVTVASISSSGNGSTSTSSSSCGTSGKQQRRSSRKRKSQSEEGTFAKPQGGPVPKQGKRKGSPASSVSPALPPVALHAAPS